MPPPVGGVKLRPSKSRAPLDQLRFGRRDRDSVNRDILVPGFQHKCTTVQNAWLRSYLHLSGSHARWRAVSLQVITRSAGASIVKAFNIHRRAACTSGCFFLNKKVYKTSSARWCTGMQSCSRVCGRRPESGRDGCCVSQAKSAGPGLVPPFTVTALVPLARSAWASPPKPKA